MKIIKRYWPVIFIFFFSFFVFYYQVFSSISFEGDLARDLYEILKISNGNLTLLGPKGSFGGIYTAPFYYYIFVPFFILFNKEITGVILFNILLFSFSISFFSYFVLKKYNQFKAFFSGIILTLFPFIIFSGKNPGNGFTHLSFFLIFLSILFFLDINKFNLIKNLFFGFLFGLIISMQYSYFPVVISLLVFIFFFYKNKKNFLFFIIGIIFSFSPLILFEIKNHFIMLKNTFIDRSYLLFVENKNLPYGIKLNKNIFLNSLFLVRQFSFYLGINFFLGFIFIISSLFFIKNKKTKYLIFSLIFSFFILIFLLRYQYSFHYLFPFLGLFAFVFLIAVNEVKFNKIFFLLSLFFLIFNFPKNYFHNSVRNYWQIKNRAEKLVEKNWLSKGDRFNVFFIRDDNLPSPAGNEYRFFLLKKGFLPLDEFSYKNSDKLLIFSEKTDIDIKKLKDWEILEFDFSKVKSIESFSPDKNIMIYLLKKTF